MQRQKNDEAAKAESEMFPQVCAAKADVGQVTEAPQQQPPQRSTAESAVIVSESSSGPQRTRQRTAEQVIDVTQRVQAKAEGSIARAVRLELEGVRFEKEARRRFLRARAQSPHRQRDQRD